MEGQFAAGQGPVGYCCATAAWKIVRREGGRLHPAFRKCFDLECYCNPCVQQKLELGSSWRSWAGCYEGQKGYFTEGPILSPPPPRHSAQSQLDKVDIKVQIAQDQISTSSSRPIQAKVPIVQCDQGVQVQCTQGVQEKEDASTQTDEELTQSSRSSRTYARSTSSQEGDHRGKRKKKRSAAARRRYRRKVLKKCTVVY